MADGEPQAAGRIFICYRRDDSTGFARALLGPLRARFGPGRIFKDTENVRPGEDFVKVISRELQSCQVVLAVIGNEWAGALDVRTKQRRLDNPTDTLRVELAAALRNENITVIPVLVDRATMPPPEELPEDLRDLTRRNAVELSDTRWDMDIERLIRALEVICGDEPQAEPDDGRWQGEPPARPARHTSGDDGSGFTGRVDLRRYRQIAEHLEAAREAFEIQDLETVLTACEHALWLDSENAEARELSARAQAAIDEKALRERLDDAQRALAKGDLSAASEAVDLALARSPEHPAALALRQALLRARLERDRQAEESRLAADRARQEQNAEAARHEAQAKRAADREEAARREVAKQAAEQARRDADAEGPPRGDAAPLPSRTRAPADSARTLGQRIVELPAAALRWLGERIRPTPRPRPAPHLPVPSPADTPTASPVLLGASAPREVAPGDNFTVRFVAYVEARESVVLSRLEVLAGAAPSTTIVGLSPLKGGCWRTGTPVTVLGAGEHLKVLPPRQSFEWNGREQILIFPVSVTSVKSPSATAICFEVFIEGVPIARVALDIQIRDRVTDVGMNRIDARAPETAFASYAKEDRSIVTQCLSALRRHDPGLDIFVDCLDLQPNSEWEKELARVIPMKDVFFLFWSRHAMRSQWVQWELQTIKATRGLGVVCPMPLDDPANAPPPSELAHLNFGDRYLTARDSAFAREAPSTPD